MGEYKLNWRYKFFTCFLLIFVYPIVKVMIMFLGHKINDENGEPLSTGWLIAAGIPVFLFGTLYIFVAFSMLYRLIKNRGKAFVITENGIENTFTFFVVLAFILHGRVKLIPWEAIKSVDKDGDSYTLKVDISKIKATKTAKLHIKLMGYNFCRGFTKPLSKEDFRLYIEPYINR